MARAAAWLVAAALAMPSWAFEIELAGRKLSIEAPEGYCPLEQTNARDKSFLDRLSSALGEDHQLLLMFTDCEELKQFRARRADRFQRFGQITALRERGAPIAALGGVSRNAYSAEATATFGRLTEPAARADALRRLDQEIAEGRLSGLRNLGLLDRDGAGAYLGIVSRIEAPGDPHVLASVTTATLLREIRLSINLYRRYENAETFPALLAEQKRIAQRLIEKNGETIEPVPADEKPLAGAIPGGASPPAPAPYVRSMDGLDWSVVAGIVSLLAAIGAGLLLVLRKRG